MAYDTLEPFGAIRDNWHMAVQASLFSAAHTPKGKQPPSPSEFIYKTPEERAETNKQTFLSFLKSKAKHGDRRK